MVVKRTISDINLIWPSYAVLNDTANRNCSNSDGKEIVKKKVALKCKYIIDTGDKLGDGNFSTVNKCQNVITKSMYAMKLIDKKSIKNKMKLVSREINLLKIISDKIRCIETRTIQDNGEDVFIGHHHVLQIFDFFETSSNIALITQLCAKGDLYEKIISDGSLDFSSEVKSYTACLLSVLNFLHDNGIVHRDLKAENVFFRLKSGKTDNRYTAHDLILGDFGLATMYLDLHSNSADTSLKEYVGTISYIAPEIVACKDVSLLSLRELDNLNHYGTPVDIWSIGVLTYFMNFGYTPFDCDTDDETLECISKADYYIDQDSIEDEALKDFWSFVRSCFILDANKRPSASALKYHPLVREYFSHSINDEKLILSEVVEGYPAPTYLKEGSILETRKSSTGSLHSLKSPLKSASSSSLTSLHKAATFTTASSSTSANISRINSVSASINSPISSINKSISSSSLVNSTRYLDPHQQRLPFSKKRESIKKTLSMTSIKKVQGKQNSTVNFNFNFTDFSDQSETNNTNENSNIKSTFTLDPKPPFNSLMNGCFSAMPEAKKHLDDETPRSLSRPNSSSSLFFLEINDNHENNNENSIENININDALQSVLSENLPFTKSTPHLFTTKKATFQFGEDFDEDDD